MARKALVVDDSPAEIANLKSILSDAGCMVVTASGGKEAVEKAKAEKPSIIFLDIVMPDMDGYAVLRTLRSARETRDIPIVFISAQGDSGPAMSYGANFYLEKPIDIDQLRAAAEQALGTH